MTSRPNPLNFSTPRAETSKSLLRHRQPQPSSSAKAQALRALSPHQPKAEMGATQNHGSDCPVSSLATLSLAALQLRRCNDSEPEPEAQMLEP